MVLTDFNWISGLLFAGLGRLLRIFNRLQTTSYPI